MNCPACGAENPDGNKFCGGCGAALPTEADAGGVSDEEQLRELDALQDDAEEGAEDLQADEPEPVEVAEDEEDDEEQETPLQSMTPTDTTDSHGEREVWRGRYSNRAACGGLLFTLLVAIVLSVVGVILMSKFESVTVRWIIWIVIAVLVLVVLVRALAKWAKHRFTLRYRLTTERLFVEKGLFSRTRDEIELIRVDDVRVRQSVMDRIFKVGQITVVSTDPTLGAYTPDRKGKDDQGRRGDVGAFTLWGIDEPDGVKEKIRHYTRARRKRSLHVENL